MDKVELSGKKRRIIAMSADKEGGRKVMKGKMRGKRLENAPGMEKKPLSTEDRRVMRGL